MIVIQGWLFWLDEHVSYSNIISLLINYLMFFFFIATVMAQNEEPPEKRHAQKSTINYGKVPELLKKSN